MPLKVEISTGSPAPGCVPGWKSFKIPGCPDSRTASPFGGRFLLLSRFLLTLFRPKWVEHLVKHQIEGYEVFSKITFGISLFLISPVLSLGDGGNSVTLKAFKFYKVQHCYGTFAGAPAMV